MLALSHHLLNLESRQAHFELELELEFRVDRSYRDHYSSAHLLTEFEYTHRAMPVKKRRIALQFRFKINLVWLNKHSQACA